MIGYSNAFSTDTKINNLIASEALKYKTGEEQNYNRLLQDALNIQNPIIGRLNDQDNRIKELVKVGKSYFADIYNKLNNDDAGNFTSNLGSNYFVTEEETNDPDVLRPTINDAYQTTQTSNNKNLNDIFGLYALSNMDNDDEVNNKEGEKDTSKKDDTYEVEDVEDDDDIEDNKIAILYALYAENNKNLIELRKAVTNYNKKSGYKFLYNPNFIHKRDIDKWIKDNNIKFGNNITTRQSNK
jgi:hypothetical protein